MRPLMLLALPLVLLAGCRPDGGEAQAVTATATEPPAFMVGRVQLCHRSGAGTRLIELPGGAEDLAQHVDGHGDWLVGPELPGSGRDEDCDGLVDEPPDIRAPRPLRPGAGLVLIEATSRP